jgi:hypothetical protein
MIRVWGLVKGYTPVKINLPGCGRVKVNIRTKLLKPAGETIGTLHLNGTTIHVFENTHIIIGSDPQCDIRIKDPAVKPLHALINSIRENATVEHLFDDGKTGILTAAQGTKTITSSDEPLSLGNGDIVFLPLSGKKKLLSIGFRLRQTLAESIRNLMTTELSPALQTTTIPDSLEKALAKVALAEAREVARQKETKREVEAKKGDPLGVRGTSFEGIKTLRSLFIMYFRRLLSVRFIDYVHPVKRTNRGGSVDTLQSHRQSHFNRNFNSILKGLDPDLCAHALLQLPRGIRTAIIREFGRYDYETFGAIISRLR